MIVNAVDQEAVRRIAAVVGEDGDAGLPRRDEADQRAPTEPAPGVPDNALAAVARRAEAEPVMAVTDFLIFGGGFVDPRRLHLPDQLRRKQALALEFAFGQQKLHPVGERG